MSRTYTFNASDLVPGANWSLAINVTAASPVFPAGATYSANVKYNIGDSAALTALTSAGSNFTRTSDYALTIAIPGATSAAWVGESIVFDVFRTDTSPKAHLFQVGVGLHNPT